MKRRKEKKNSKNGGGSDKTQRGKPGFFVGKLTIKNIRFSRYLGFNR